MFLQVRYILGSINKFMAERHAKKWKMAGGDLRSCQHDEIQQQTLGFKARANWMETSGNKSKKLGNVRKQLGFLSYENCQHQTRKVYTLHTCSCTKLCKFNCSFFFFFSNTRASTGPLDANETQKLVKRNTERKESRALQKAKCQRLNPEPRDAESSPSQHA